MQQQKPTFTVVIPTFNRAALIGSALSALQNQTLQSWEALIIDDQSEDQTMKVVHHFQKLDSRYKYILNKGTKGACHCRNIGIELATGRFTIFLDSDDILLPYALERRAKLALMHPDKAFVVHPGAVATENIGLPNLLWNIESNIPDVQRFLSFDSPWQTTGPTWNTEFLKISNLRWDEKLTIWQDIDFHLGALKMKFPYEVFWEAEWDYIVNNTTTDSISRVGFHAPEKSASKLHFWQKLLASGNASGIHTEWLKPVAVSVSRHLAVNRDWRMADQVINEARSHRIVSIREARKLKHNLVFNRLSKGRISFPHPRFFENKGRGVTLQQVGL